MDQHCGSDVRKIILGNKCDLHSEVDYNEALKFSLDCGVPHTETSAKSGLNVDNAIMELVAQILQAQETKKEMDNTICVIEEKASYSTCF